MHTTQEQHGILCGVTSCEYQQNGGCTLTNISVQPCRDCTSEKKEDQSMCSSYKAC